MRLKLLLFLTTLFSVNCYPCSPGYFTKAYPCDRRAVLLHNSEYSLRTVRKGRWRFYYLPLLGIEGNLGLDVEFISRPLNAYVNIQSADNFKLPNDIDFDYAFELQNGKSNIPIETLTKGMKNKNEGRMLLAIRNPYFSNANIKIRYFTSPATVPVKERKDPHRISSSSNKLVVGVIIGIIATALIAFVVGVVVYRTIQKRRNAVRIENDGRRVESDAQGIIYAPPQSNQNNVKPSDSLTWEELQKFFPKKNFKTLENPFQQTGCSVCLEEFQPRTGCHQLHCNHIFHGACIQQWLQKQNSCPGCRVSLEKKAIEEYLDKQKKENEDDSFNAIQLKIEAGEVTTK